MTWPPMSHYPLGYFWLVHMTFSKAASWQLQCASTIYASACNMIAKSLWLTQLQYSRGISLKQIVLLYPELRLSYFNGKRSTIIYTDVALNEHIHFWVLKISKYSNAHLQDKTPGNSFYRNSKTIFLCLKYS